MPLFKPKRMVTLDIGNHSIKMAEFVIKKKQPFLEHFSIFSIPEHCIQQGTVDPIESLKEPLSDFISENTLDSVRDLSMAIGGKFVFVKKLEVLNSERELLDEMVQVEVKQNLPFNVGEVNYDYSAINSPRPKESNKINVLLIVALCKVVSDYDALFRSMGYNCQTIDTHGFALETCFQCAYPKVANQKNSNVVLLDIGKSGTNFIVLHGGKLIFDRYITIGTGFYVNNIMQEMGVSLQEAESLYLSSGVGEAVPAEMSQIISDSNRYFCDEILEGVEYFKNQFPDQPFMECYVTGGGAKMVQLINDIGKALGVPTQVFDPFAGFKYSEVLKDSINHIKYFVPVSIGLCLREMK